MHDHQQIEKTKLSYNQRLATQLITAVIIIDDDLHIRFMNPAAEALLTKSFYKLYNTHVADTVISTSFDSNRFKQVLLTGQEFTENDVLFSLADGNRITVEITASAAEFNDTPHVLLELKQIDQQKQISEEAFQHQQWEAARDLIKGLAHEIKNPLGGLRGAAQLLSKELSSEQQEYTSMIIEQSDRLTTLVDRLLGPNQLPQMVTENIHLVLEKIIKLTSFNNPKKIKIKRDYDPSIPEINIDEDKLQQAVLNIVNNAIQAITPDDTITLKTRIASNQTLNSKRIRLCIVISIIDDGPGIPEKIQDTLFYPMVSGRSDGTGLGLSISQTLVHQHNGKLTCSSKPGRTEFTILLPIPEES